MKNTRIFYLFSVLLLAALLLCSCTGKLIQTDNPASDGNTNQDGTYQGPTEQFDIIYFDVAQNKKLTAEVTFQGEPTFAMNFLLGKVSEFTKLEIDYNNIISNPENQSITVDFKKDGSPVNGLGSAGEAAVLDSITETMFANYPEIDQVFFTCDDGVYSSGHVELEKGEAYRTRQHEKTE